MRAIQCIVLVPELLHCTDEVQKAETALFHLWDHNYDEVFIIRLLLVLQFLAILSWCPGSTPDDL